MCLLACNSVLPICCCTYLEGMYCNVGESRLFHSLTLNIILDDGEGHAHLLAPLIEELAPLAQRRVVRDGAVVAFDPRHGFEALDPATGSAALISLLKKRRPVEDATKQPAHVDIIDRLGLKSPLARAILNLTRKGKWASQAVLAGCA